MDEIYKTFYDVGNNFLKINVKIVPIKNESVFFDMKMSQVHKRYMMIRLCCEWILHPYTKLAALFILVIVWKCIFSHNLFEIRWQFAAFAVWKRKCALVSIPTVPIKTPKNWVVISIRWMKRERREKTVWKYTTLNSI